jgi:hypothetical protein
MLMGNKPVTPAKLGSYDPGSQGARAAFLLLQQMGKDVAASKRIVEGKVRWVLEPRERSKQFEALPAWVRAGGKLLLADDKNLIAESLGIHATEETIEQDKHRQTTKIGEQTVTIETGAIELVTELPPDRTWPDDASEPLVSIYQVGRGEVWLVHYPQFMQNDLLKRSMQEGRDNGLVVLELADAMVGDGGERIWFDEYFHGMRVHPSVFELLTTSPFIWVSLQGVLLLLLTIWHYAPRFGTFQEQLPVRRRSKEEYLRAMANILERKHAYDLALGSVRNAVIRDLAQALSLPAEIQTTELARQAVARWPAKFNLENLTALLSQPLSMRAKETDFLRALHELEAIRHVYQSH